MKLTTRTGRRCLLPLLAGLLMAGPYTAGAQESDAARLVTEQAAAGRKFHSSSKSSRQVPATSQSKVTLERMLLLLQPTAAQQQSLDDLLSAQVTPESASFHKWLTPAEFASRFAVSATDAATVVAWLRGQGFTVAALPESRGWVEFSGTAARVERSFSPEIRYMSFYGKAAPIQGILPAHVEAVQLSGDGTGEIHYRLPGEINLPASIAPIVKGLVSLDGVVSATAFTTVAQIKASPAALASESVLSRAAALTPALAKQWLHLSSLQAEGLTGAGESIAIPSRSNVRPEDVAAFRKSFGLPDAELTVALSGIDPGRTDEEAATVQALSWAGAMAPEAHIVLIPAASTNATDGLDLALAATIDGALAHTVSVGYSACESSLSATHRAFYAALYRQAAAEGIAIIAATGDSGAAACHRPEDANPVASGQAVNALASTPWNTAVGAVAFTSDAGSLSGWGPAKSTDPAYASGGGFSSLYGTPDWQSAIGVPVTDPGTASGHHRYLPDVSLPTAMDGLGSHGLVFCFSGDSAASGCRLASAGGSSASAAIFSGISALLAQKYGPQGNLAANLYTVNSYTLYRSEAGSQAPTAFLDITSGAAKLACVHGSLQCSEAGEIGYSAAEGFDLASGLGSINAQALIQNWATPQDTGTAPVTVEMTTPGGVTYNPSATITLSAKVLSGSGSTVPTGTVQFYDQTTSANAGPPATLASDGTASYSETGQFTAGGHNIQAKYSGDSVYEAAVSQPVTINIQPSPTSLIVTPSTTTPTGGSIITVTGTVVASNPGATAPSGTLTVNLDGLPQGTARLATSGTTTSASVNVTVPTAGSHTVQGTYSGDTNYNNSTSPSVTIVVAKSATVTMISAIPATLTTGVPETFTATIAPAAAGATTYSITGTVSFYDLGSTLLGTAPISNNTAILTGITLSTTTSHTITAVYSGDTTYSPSVSSPLLLTAILAPVTVTLVESNAILAPDQPVTLTATVTPVNTPPVTAEQHPSGFVLFYAGSTLISGQTPVLVGLGYSGVASTFVPRLPAGQYLITARYSGDPTYGPAISNSLTLGVQDFTISCSVNNITMVQGTTQSVTCNVASLGGLTGPIQVVCSEQNPPQTGVIPCTFSPGTINGTGATTLTVVTTKGSGVASNDKPRNPANPPWPAAGGGIALAFVGILLSPIGRRARWVRVGVGRKLLVLALLLSGMAATGIGCTNTVTLNNPTGGTPLGVHTLKITAASEVNTVTVSHNAYLTVNVTP